MEFWIQQDNNGKLQLPVKPSDYTITVTNRNTTVNVIKAGDINLIGNTGLREITLASFFPAMDYSFSNNTDRKAPVVCVNTLEGWRISGKPVRVIITGVLNMEATIESFSYGQRDATGDIYYSMYLKEYKKVKTQKATVNVATAKSSSTRSTQSTGAISGGKYTVKKGDNLWKIAKQAYGKGSRYLEIYEANKKILKSPSLIYAGQVITIP